MAKRKIESANTNESLNELVARKVSRRGVLKLTAFMGAAAVAAPIMGAAQDVAAQSGPTLGGFLGSTDEVGFSPLAATTKDDLVLAPGYTYNVVRSWGDPVNATEKFGAHNDFIAYFPIDELTGGNSSTEGLLWVNHEYFQPLLTSGRADATAAPTADQIAKEKLEVGGSVIHVKQNASGGWDFLDDAKYNRRVTALTPIALDGPAAGSEALKGVTEVIGSVGNCGGGHTPWGTALSGEENYQSYKPATSAGGYGWGDTFNEDHYGWVVEIDPFNKDAKPVKHTALGRFQHEGATTTLGNSGKAVVYTGHDAQDQCVYKFVSKNSYSPTDRAANLKLLSEGTLYVANFSSGRWIPVDYASTKALQDKYKNQAEVLVKTAEAAPLIGGTPTDRPEDIKINPLDKSVFIAFTNNSRHGNFHGHITRIFEANNDHEATTFEWEVFAVGGSQKGAGFSSPDNLAFNKNGDLYIFTDISSSSIGKGIYRFAGNNAIYKIPTTGANAGVAFRLGSSPVEAEVTGPAFTPDGLTLFMSIQHPGEDSPSMDKLTSTWPNNSKMPKSSIVAIKGFK